jgi:spermidine synthase
MKYVVPNGKSGDWTVDTFKITKDEAARYNLFSAIRNQTHMFVEPGTYKRLMHNRTIVMSNTPMEMNSHALFVKMAEGEILINGLGLGMALSDILKKKNVFGVQNVFKVTIIEKNFDVIKLVGPTFIKDDRVKIIHEDAFTYKPPKGTLYNVVWHDIWNDICSDNLSQMRKLRKKYTKICGWQGCWSEDMLDSRY